MLSIGKLAAGQAKYYLDQAEVRVDAVAASTAGSRSTTWAGSRLVAMARRGAVRLGLDG